MKLFTPITKVSIILLLTLTASSFKSDSNFQTDLSYLVSEPWRTSLSQAKNKNKAIFLACYTDWCGKCKLMQNRVFIEESVKQAITSKFHGVKMDMEDPNNKDAKSLLEKYTITSYPSFLIIGSDGRLISLRNNIETKEALLSWINSL